MKDCFTNAAGGNNGCLNAELLHVKHDAITTGLERVSLWFWLNVLFQLSQV